jgi:hypothetical protein
MIIGYGQVLEICRKSYISLKAPTVFVESVRAMVVLKLVSGDQIADAIRRYRVKFDAPLDKDDTGLDKVSYTFESVVGRI